MRASSPPDDDTMTNDGKAGHRIRLRRRGGGGGGSGGGGLSQLLRSAYRNVDQCIAMASNYGTSYNAVNVGIALPVLNYCRELERRKREGEEEGPYSSPSYIAMMRVSTYGRNLDGGESIDVHANNEDEQDSLVASSLMAGMIVGQLLGGLLGDVLGRSNAMMLVMMLQICGSLGSAFLVSTSNDYHDIDGDGGGLTSLEQLAIWRFVLGMGAGGV
jgi:hypothetical protein